MKKSKFVVSKYYGENPGEIDTQVFDTYEEAKKAMIEHCGFTKEEVEQLENGVDDMEWDEALDGAYLDDDRAGVMCGTPYAEQNDIEFDVVAHITEVTFD